MIWARKLQNEIYNVIGITANMELYLYLEKISFKKEDKVKIFLDKNGKNFSPADFHYKTS